MKLVGYLVNYPEGREGETGLYYNYVMASNGLFIEAENKLMAARIPVAECDVRGLAPLEAKVSLTYGSIPQRFFDLALDVFLADPEQEHYIAVTGDAGYHLYVPVQDKNGGTVAYEVGENVVLDLHSHGCGSAWFSPGDNKDETGLKLYGVVGSLGRTPIIKLRAGIYGYFYPLVWKDVFDGTLTGALEFQREEVVSQDELQGFLGDDGAGLRHHLGRLWGNWWFRR